MAKELEGGKGTDRHATSRNGHDTVQQRSHGDKVASMLICILGFAIGSFSHWGGIGKKNDS